MHASATTRSTWARGALALSLLAGSSLLAVVSSAPATAAPALTTPAASTVHTVGATIHFASGSAVLTSQSAATLASLVRSLPAGATVTTVDVRGYVQRSGNAANDLTLSTARARATATYLHRSRVGGTYTILGLRVYGTAASARRATVSISYRSQSGQTITFAQPAGLAVGDEPESLSATSSAGLPVTVSSTTSAVCTVTGSVGSYRLAAVSAGSCTLRATQAGSATFAAAAPVSRTVTVGHAGQTITFAQPAALQVGDADEALTATSTSSLPVTVTSTTAGICTVLGTPGSFTLHAVSAGTCSLSASQAGNGSYGAATAVTRSVTVSLRPQTITFAQPAAMHVGDEDASLTATSTSSLPVTIVSSTPEVCTVLGSPGSYTLHVVGAGTCSLSATQAGGATYAPATAVDRTVAISVLAQTITFTQPADMLMGDEDGALSATSSSSLPVMIASSTAEVCTVLGTPGSYTLHVVGAGTCSLSATQDGDASYAAATAVPRTVTIAQRTQTITFTQPADMLMGDEDGVLPATSSSSLPVTIASSSTEVCTVLGTPGSYTLHVVGAGTCSLSATQDGDATYAAATAVPRTVTIAQRTQSITFTQPADMLMGDEDGVLSATSSSSLPVTIASSTTDVCTVLGTPGSYTLHVVGAGTCSLSATQDGDATYAAATAVPRTVTVSLQTQTITFTQPSDMHVGDPDQDLSATSDKALDVTITSTTTDVCTVTGSPGAWTLTAVSAGDCSLTASQAGNDSVSPAQSVVRAVTLAPALSPQTISFSGPPALWWWMDIPQPLTATSTSGLPVTVTNMTPWACTLTGSPDSYVVVPVLFAFNTCDLEADQAGDGTTWLPAPPQYLSIMVAPD